MENVKVDWYTASWCGPCRVMAPVIAELKAEGWQIEKIDADANRDLVVKNQIGGIPTFILYKNGVQVDRFSGARSKQALLSALTRAAG